MAQYDLIVIGSGPGGYVAAERAGRMGKKVLLIERDQLGGVCTNHGCIPTKSLLNAAKLYRHARESQAMGIVAQSVSFDLATAMAWKRQTVETLRNGIQFLVKSAKVDVVFGEAQCIDPHRVAVGETIYDGKYLIVATGSSPAIPPIQGVDLPHVLTSDDILEIDSIPDSLVIIGGGVIGIEFASFFSSLGTKVSVIEMLDEIVPLMDVEFAKLLRRDMKGVEFYLGCTVKAIDKDGVHFVDAKGKSTTIAAELVLLSVGRRPNLSALEQLDLAVDRTGVIVDERMRTNIPNVYAIGDVNGRSLLAHSASRMAEVAVSNIFGTDRQRMRYHAIPWAVYGIPEAAGCGLTEQEGNKSARNIVTATTQMRANGRFLAEQGKRSAGLCKVVVDAQTQAIVGIHLLGPYSSEIIWGAAALIEAELRVQDVQEIVFPHPSVSEVIKDTIMALAANKT